MSATAKETLRQEMRRRRANAAPAVLHAFSRSLAGRLRDLPALRDAPCIAAFLAMPREPNLDALLAEWAGAGKQILVPVLDPAQDAYRLAQWRPEIDLRTGPHGIREPAAPVWANPRDAQAMLVPGLAFDRHGNRLGHGGGVFDRLLAGFDGIRLGVCFPFQLIDRVPANEQDQPMHAVLTPEADYWTERATHLSYP